MGMVTLDVKIVEQVGYIGVTLNYSCVSNLQWLQVEGNGEDMTWYISCESTGSCGMDEPNGEVILI